MDFVTPIIVLPLFGDNGWVHSSHNALFDVNRKYNVKTGGYNLNHVSFSLYLFTFW